MSVLFVGDVLTNTTLAHVFPLSEASAGLSVAGERKCEANAFFSRRARRDLGEMDVAIHLSEIALRRYSASSEQCPGPTYPLL